MNLTTKNITIQILCVSSKTAVTCSANFDLKDAPDNNSMSTQLEAVSESGATFEMHVKVRLQLLRLLILLILLPYCYRSHMILSMGF